MKKLTSIVILLCLVLSLAACSDSKDLSTTTADGATDAASQEPTTKTTASGANLGVQLDTGMKEYFNQLEYTLYYNLFYNQDLSEVNTEMTKEGTFTVLTDAYNNVDRYYVWGYLDQTKCCSYQWEFVLPEGADIPANGSYVKVKGKFVPSDDALDGYWLTDVEFTVEEEFKDTGFDYDLTTFSNDLTRVQIINMQQFPDKFDGKKLRVFGRALGLNTIQDPYYDNSWSIDFKDGKADKFAIGDDILLTGSVNGKDGSMFIDAEKVTLLK